jgi:putative membrane protein
MSRMIGLLMCVIFSVGIAACGREQPGNAEQTAAAPPAVSADKPTGTTGGTADVDFVREQLAVGEKQLGLARLASQRATRPAVKKFGESLLRDYQQATEDLRQIAARQGVNAPREADQLRVEGDRLSRLSGEQFEREYLTEIITDHQDAVGDLEKAAKGGTPEIRQWAAQTLPIVRRHLEEARQLRK